MEHDTWATPADASAAAQNWATEVLECRTWGHNWRITASVFVARYRYYAITWACPRCHTQRHQELNKRGTVLASWYIYPDGYLSDVGRIAGDARDALRVAVLNRMSTPSSMRDEPPHSGATRRDLGLQRTKAGA